MLFAEIPSGLQTALVGVAILFVAFLMRRTAVRVGRSKNRDPAKEVRNAFLQAEQKGKSKIEQLEIRLYDHSREVEARIETRIAMLDQLVQSADEEVARLKTLLDLKPQSSCSNNSLPDDSARRMIRHLCSAGFSISEVAGLTGCPEQEIRDVLPDDSEAA